MAGLAGPDIGKRMVKLARAIEGANADTVKAAAEKAKAEHLRIMRPDTGGDLMLSGVGRAKGRPGNAKVGVSYKVTRKGSSAEALVKATGPLQIINNDTSGRVIRSAWSKGRARRGFVGPVASGQFSGGRTAVLNIPGIGFRRSVRHPGTKGKRTWRRGLDKARPVIRKAMDKQTTTAIKRGMTA